MSSNVLLLPPEPKIVLPWEGPQHISGFTRPGWEFLGDVPPGPTGPADADRYRKWEARQEYADQLRSYRLQTLHDLKDNRRLQAIEREKGAADPAYFISVYGWIVEPRRRKASISGLGGSGTKPWILVERQVQLLRWIRWVEEQEDENADGLISKARDWGVSWTFVADSAHKWIFEEDGYTTLFISQQEELVDGKSPKALLKKFDQFTQRLPGFLMPPGYAPTRNRFFKTVENPQTGSMITGTTTTATTGRSDRVSRIFIDEAAMIPELEHIYAGLTDVTDHRFMASSENLEHTEFFYNMRKGQDVEERCAVFEADWWQLHDEEWLRRAKKRYATMPNGEAHFQREIGRQPESTSNWVYPETRMKSPQSGLDYIPGMPVWVTIDPGHDDQFACIYIMQDLRDNRFKVLDGYTNNLLPAAFYGPLITGDLVDTEGNPIAGPWQYTEWDLEKIAWVKSFAGRPKYIGDTYGDNVQGASADSWYDVWRRNHNLEINVDRLPSGKLAAYRMAARTHVGRRKAARWILPSVDFADTVGARQVLHALQNNSFGRMPKSGKLPESGMLRDQTTHYTSAFEFWAVNMELMASLTLYNEDRTKRQESEERDTRTGHRFGRQSYEIFERPQEFA
jgi:hypothetical protein